MDENIKKQIEQTQGQLLKINTDIEFSSLKIEEDEFDLNYGENKYFDMVYPDEMKKGKIDYIVRIECQRELYNKIVDIITK